MTNTRTEENLQLYYKSLRIVDEALSVVRRSLERERTELINRDYCYEWVQEKIIDLDIETYQVLRDWRSQLLKMIEGDLDKLITANSEF